MSCTNWCSSSMSAPYSASSAMAIVGVLIVDSAADRLVGRTSTRSGTTMASPAGTAAAARQAASGYALRTLPRACGVTPRSGTPAEIKARAHAYVSGPG